MCAYVDGYLSQNGYRFALRDGPRIEEPLDNPPADGQSHLPPPPPSPGGAGLSLLHRELLPVNCTESYSRSATPRATRSATPRATPGLLHRELLQVCYTESYSRSIAPRATPGLLLFNKWITIVHVSQRNVRTQSLLGNAALKLCGHNESYSRFATTRATPGLLRRQPATETALRLHGTRTVETGRDRQGHDRPDIWTIVAHHP